MLPAGTFAGQVVAITGGGTGLGLAMGLEFARLGATVAIMSRSAEHHARGISAIEAAGGKAAAFEVDVRDPEKVQSAFRAAEAQLGPIGTLINNAAGNFASPAEDLSANAWRAVLQIVLDGTFFCSREFARLQMARESPGAILNIGASYAWTGGAGTAHSAAAKAGITNLAMSLAVEWAPAGIRVNTLVPGPFPHEDSPTVLKKHFGNDRGAARIPAGRVGQLHELGWAATYLCSPFAAFVTGMTFVIDGGYWLRRGPSAPDFVPIRTQLGKGEFDPRVIG
jgi:NAD(P)-dependent dehydrogenase (short-subunit alcohol dehydrogenase family)